MRISLIWLRRWSGSVRVGRQLPATDEGICKARAATVFDLEVGQVGGERVGQGGAASDADLLAFVAADGHKKGLGKAGKGGGEALVGLGVAQEQDAVGGEQAA